MNTYVCKQIVFVVQPLRSPDLNPLDFYLWGHVNILVYSSVTENGQTLHQNILMSVKPFAVIRCALRALSHMDILSICCEL